MARSIPIVLAMLLAGGCWLRHPEPDPAGAHPGAHLRTVMLSGGFLEIHIEAPDEPPGPKPTVISYVEEFRVPLLEAGFTVVTYALHWELLRDLAKPPPAPAPPPADATPPPETKPPPRTWGKWLLASPSPDVIGKGYLGLIDANARSTVPNVLDALATDPDVDPKRIGIIGFSTNGFTALQAASLNRRLRATVAIAACGDFHTFLHRSTLAMDGEPLALAPDYDAWLHAVEPRRHPMRLVHTALLMVNGRADLPIPLACAETTARALRRAYRSVGRRDHFRLVVVDGGHAMGPRAQREAMGWLRRWLADR